MRFEIRLRIEAPPETVWRLFTDRAVQSKWQATLQSTEPVSGTPGAPGAVTRVTYREAGRPVVMLETLETAVAPREHTARYAADVSDSVIRNAFAADGAGTIWSCEVSLAFKGLFKLLAPVVKPLAAKKTRDDMLRFKALAESAERE